MSGGDYAGEASGNTFTRLSQAYYSGPTVSLFNEAEHINICDSQINAHIHVQGNTGLNILGKNSAIGATYNSLERQKLDAPKCHHNTRVAVMKRLINWFKGELDSDTLILWLHGAAGAGKSAIAYTIAEICEKDGLLLATFFFWKTAAERNNINRFVATIAYQIACAILVLRPLIDDAVLSNPMLFQKSIDAQLLKLIIEPLKRLHSTGFDFKDSPFVIIIDGLDECQGNDVKAGLVKSLAAAFCHSPLRIRILIASRPEVYLQSAFNSSLVQPHLSRLALSDEYSAEEDIYQFLKDSFETIRREHPLASYIPFSWPSAEVLHELTRKSSGQFIFASTTVKYIGGDPHQLPHRRLDVIRRLQPPKGEEDMPYVELNSLYHHVLSNVNNVEAIKQILGVLIILNPKLGHYLIDLIDKMDNFFFWQPGEAKACLSQLASIIKCDTDGRISVLHASLSDFLLDPSRSNQFYLCQESILGDYAALGLRHLHQQWLDTDDFKCYRWVSARCIDTGPLCTPQFRQELGQLSFQTLYRNCKMHKSTWYSWGLFSMVIEMLHEQNLEEQYPHLISDLPTVCFQAFQRADPDNALTLLVYEAHYSHLIQIEASNPASAFPFKVLYAMKQQFRVIIKEVVNLHPERQRLELTGRHYTMVAKYFIGNYLKYFYPRLCRSSDEFHGADDSRKRDHSATLSALLCITHVLPLANKSEDIMKQILLCTGNWEGPNSFHANYTLDGWNDGIIQPARDAVLDYYRRYAELSKVQEYMRLNNLS